MRQVELLGIVRAMEKGQCFNLSVKDAQVLASEDMPLLDRMAGGANGQEVMGFLRKIRANWGLETEHNFEKNLIILRKL